MGGRNAADPRAREEQEKRIQARDEQLKADVAMLMADPKFRRFVGAMLQEFDPMKQVDFNGSANYFLDGKAEAGKWMVDLLARSCQPHVFAQVIMDWRRDILGVENA